MTFFKKKWDVDWGPSETDDDARLRELFMSAPSSADDDAVNLSTKGTYGLEVCYQRDQAVAESVRQRKLL